MGYRPHEHDAVHCLSYADILEGAEAKREAVWFEAVCHSQAHWGGEKPWVSGEGGQPEKKKATQRDFDRLYSEWQAKLERHGPEHYGLPPDYKLSRQGAKA